MIMNIVFPIYFLVYAFPILNSSNDDISSE
jgi:hypothetical protein